MFSLILVICQGFSCKSFTPPVVFYTEEQCIDGANIIFTMLEDETEKTLKEMKCVDWGEQT